MRLAGRNAKESATLNKRVRRQNRVFLVAGLAFCVSSAACLSQSDDKREPVERSYQVTKFVEGQLAVDLNGPQLQLGIVNKLTIKLGVHHLNAVYLDLQYYGNDGELHPDYNRGNGEEKVAYDPDGNAYVTFEPDKVGKVRLTFLIDVDSDERDVERKDAEVVLPVQQPEKFMI